MAMKLVLKTAEHKIFLRGDNRYAVQDANGKPVNGEEKVNILIAAELIKVTAPTKAARDVEETVEEASEEVAAREEAPAEEEAPADEPAEEEAPAEEPAEEEAPAEEPAEEAPAEEPVEVEAPAEEPTEEAPAEESTDDEEAK